MARARAPDPTQTCLELTRAAPTLLRRGHPRVTVPVRHADCTVVRSPLADVLLECRHRRSPSQIRAVERAQRVPLG